MRNLERVKSEPERKPTVMGNPSDSADVGSNASWQEAIFPDELRRAEIELIARRRESARIDAGTNRVGVACSGGGIRSATTCLGFFQALAQEGVLPRIDYISTVSGGGYFGSFLGALYERGHAEHAPPSASQSDVVSDLLTQPHSPAVAWLRENGRYIAPKGPADYANIVGVYIRNWLGLHYVIGMTLLTLVLFLLSLQTLLYRLAPAASEFTHAFQTDFLFHVQWSPYTVLLLAALLFGFLPLAWAFWLTQYSPRPRLIPSQLRQNYPLYATFFVLLLAGSAELSQAPMSVVIRQLMGWGAEGVLLVGVLALVYWVTIEFQVTLGSSGSGGAPQEHASKVRNGLSTALTFSVKAVAVTGALTVVDTIALTLQSVSVSTFSISVAAVVAAIYRLAPFLSRGHALRTTISESAIASAIGFALLALVAIGWDLFGTWLTVVTDFYLEQVLVLQSLPSAWVLFLPVLVISIITGRTLSFINLSSLQQFYSSRLRRAYLGASNPSRTTNGISALEKSGPDARRSITREVTGDDIPWLQYAPHLKGGPLHLVSVTVNHTMQSESQLETQDRKGFLMAVGPAGVSVGTVSHALRDHEALAPVSCSDHQSLFADLAPLPLACEPMSLSRWMAISGAAFSTGLGARTKSGVSVLLGTANMRLGYWWQSGAAKDSSPSALRSVFRTQAYLYEEFLGRFPGTTQKHWYLSDGGHSENTGAYELIRRQIRTIILLDNGADPAYQFEDFANLVRRVRIDFGVEVEEISLSQAIADGFLNKNVDVAEGDLNFVGSLTELKKSTDVMDGLNVSKAFTSLFRVWYPDGHDPSLLLLVKPTICGHESVDVVEYAATHPLFPQEPTSDQFFDEAQWESYRRLGYSMGSTVFKALNIQ